MLIKTGWKLDLDIEHVLRGQGADPQVVTGRKPRLVEAARRALEVGLPLLAPTVAYRQMRIANVTHERVILEEGGTLSGKLASSLLASAEHVAVMACTIGAALEQRVEQALGDDPVLGFALDGLGTAGVDALLVAACAFFCDEAARLDWKTTLPLSPGMEGWETGLGQQQIFSLIDPGEAGITLTAGGMMKPRKSLTAVIGLGAQVGEQGRTCDYCSLRNTCRYQERYA